MFGPHAGVMLALGFTRVEIVAIVCLSVLCVALAVVCVLLAVYLKKRPSAKKESHTIIIYRNADAAKTEDVGGGTAAAEVREEEPAAAEDTMSHEEPAESAPDGEEEPVPTVDGEIASAQDESAAAATVPVAAAEEESTTRYNRSFRARIIQADDEMKAWYSRLKNCLLSYEKVSCRMSWKHESFSYRRNPVAKLMIKGKTLTLYLALDPAAYDDTKYKLEDVSQIAQFSDTPALYRIKSEKRVRYAEDLIADICGKLGSAKTDRAPVDYYEPYSGDRALEEKGLVKLVVEEAGRSFIGSGSFNPDREEE